MTITRSTNSRTPIEPAQTRRPPLHLRAGDCMSTNWTICKYASSFAPAKNMHVPPGSTGRKAIAVLDPLLRSSADCITDRSPSPIYVVGTSTATPDRLNTSIACPTPLLFHVISMLTDHHQIPDRQYVGIHQDSRLPLLNSHRSIRLGNRNSPYVLCHREPGR